MRFDGHGCVISQAAASMLSEHIEGSAAVDARRVSPDDALRLFGVTLTPARRACGLLAWRALQKILAEPVPAGGTRNPVMV
jgi:nitrogen fixation NifU-like protein